ncbi:MAG: DUF4242 domain-containing protein [Bacteroidia bacterium]|nr:DUF4242 domain-containing protein [Bacteroidia bacterium]
MKSLLNYSIITALFLASCSNANKENQAAETSATATADNNAQKHYFIDEHNLGTVTFADVQAAHQKDLATQGKYGVSFEKFWVDEKAGKVYCLSEAKDAASVEATHKEAHGLIPTVIYEVSSGGNDAALAGNKPMFMDVHEVGPGKITAAQVADLHKKDLAVEGKHDVNFVNYYVDEAKGVIFCVSEAPDSNAVKATHMESTVGPTSYIYPVMQGK